MPASIVNTLDGPMLVPHYDEYVTKSLVLQGCYCPAQREFLAPYVKGVVFVCGANVGAHALWMARRCDTLYAFEPQPFLANCLCGSLALGGVFNAKVLQYALGDEMGTCTFPAFNYRTACHYAGVEMDKDYGVGEVPLVTVPKVRLDLLGLPEPDFVLMDVEGMEPHCLRGMGDMRPKAMCVEWDKPDIREDIKAELSRMGYRAWVAVAPMGDPWPDQASFDLLCVHEGSGVPDPTEEALERVL